MKDKLDDILTFKTDPYLNLKAKIRPNRNHENNKIYLHDITEILLKVVLNTINLHPTFLIYSCTVKQTCIL